VDEAQKLRLIEWRLGHASRVLPVMVIGHIIVDLDRGVSTSLRHFGGRPAPPAIEQLTMLGSSPDSLPERDGFETSVPGERAYGLNLCLSPYELPFSGAQLLGLKGAHQMKWPALAGLPRVLAESDADPVAVPPGSIEQNLRGDNQRGYVGLRSRQE
jgi:hypothetical protein